MEAAEIARVEKYGYHGVSNIRKVVSRLVRDGLVDEADRASVCAAIETIRSKRTQRREWARVNDRLLHYGGGKARLQGLRDALRHKHRAAAELRAEREATRVADERSAAIRRDLLRAARVARSMGLYVKASTDRRGRVSSYYVEDITAGTSQIRISDHDVPSTWAREMAAEARGFGSYNGGADIYASATERRALWWQRAITLALHGRDVPGFDQ